MNNNVFQAGRIYRAVNGELMKLDATDDGEFVGRSQGDFMDRWQIIYYPNGTPTDPTKASWQLLPGAVDAPLPKAARFEPGKTYRTKTGKTAQVLNDHGANKTQPYRLSVNGNTVWAFGDGSFNDDQMLPGAIEDEPARLEVLEGKVDGEVKLRLDVLANRIDELDSVESLEKDIATLANGANRHSERIEALSRRVTEEVNSLSEGLKALGDALHGTDHEGENVKRRLKGIEAWTEAQAATNRTTTENQGQFDLRINDLWKALDKVRTDMETSNTVNRLTAGAAKRLDDIEAAIGIIDNRQDQFGKQALRQQGDVNDLSGRLHEVEKARAWIDTFDIKRWCDIINERLDGLVLEHAEQARVPSDRIIPRGTFMSLLNALGYEIGEYGRVRKKAVDPRLVQGQLVDSAAWTGRRKTPKPTIKGGWINVYAGRWLSGIHSTETDAKLSNDGQGSNRIACIQIPDFNEGDGL